MAPHNTAEKDATQHDTMQHNTATHTDRTKNRPQPTHHKNNTHEGRDAPTHATQEHCHHPTRHNTTRHNARELQRRKREETHDTKKKTCATHVADASTDQNHNTNRCHEGTESSAGGDNDRVLEKEDTVADSSNTGRQREGTPTYPLCHRFSSWHKAPHHRPATKREAPKQSDRVGKPELGPKLGLEGNPAQAKQRQKKQVCPPCMHSTHTQGTTRQRTRTQPAAHRIPSHKQA